MPFLTVDMEKMNPQQINAVTSSLSADEQKILQSVVEQAKQNLAEAEAETPSHSQLNRNGA
jgi:hypothetical protein